jgi:predicted outer membrane repeat protein
MRTLIGILLLLSVSWGMAQVVTTNADAGGGSLREAIANAADGDTITFDASLSGQTITLTSGELNTALNNLTIDASALANPVTIDANNNSRIFNHTGTGTFAINNLVITNGNDTGINGGGGIRSDGNVTVSNSTIMGNSAEFGGGIYVQGGTVTVSNSTISGNSATTGGGILGKNITVSNSTISDNTADFDFGFGGGARGSVITIINSTISGNSAWLGGGIWVDVDVIVTDSTISGNSANRGGGGIVGTRGSTTVINSTISDNTSGLGGGGIIGYEYVIVTDSTISGNSADFGGGIMARFDVTVTDSTISDNTAQTEGGGIASRQNVTVSNSIITGNSGDLGAGGIVSEGTVTVRNSIISDNTATDASGGGIFSFDDVTVTDSTISGNSADQLGGGIASGETVTVTNSTISGNSADRGGGIASPNTVTVSNSTISGNLATSNGGGIISGVDVTVSNSTISGNSATGNGGGIFSNGTVTFSNSTISGNSATNGGGIASAFNVTVTNSTISGNSATNGGGIASPNTVTLNNSLVLGNAAPTNPQIRADGGITLNTSAYGFAAGESTGDSFVGFGINDVFTNPVAAASAPTNAGNYTLTNSSPAINAGDNALAAGITNDLAGNNRIRQGIVDMGAYEFGSGSVINPNQDIQVRNGTTTAADAITSGTIEPLRYGTFKRGQAVTLSFLVRNPGAQVLELGELGLPSFFSNAGEPLPATLNSFESALLTVEVDTSTAGTFSGQVSLASNDPDAFENPFVFDVVVTVSNEPANAINVLPGVDLGVGTISAGQQDVALLSFKVEVPAGSVPVDLEGIVLSTDSVPNVAQASNLRLYIDGGTRGVLDNRDVFVAELAGSDLSTLTFTFPTRTFQPELPMWFIVVGDF